MDMQRFTKRERERARVKLRWSGVRCTDCSGNYVLSIFCCADEESLVYVQIEEELSCLLM